MEQKPETIYGNVTKQQAEAFGRIWKHHFGVDLPPDKAVEYLAVALMSDLVFGSNSPLRKLKKNV